MRIATAGCVLALLVWTSLGGAAPGPMDILTKSMTLHKGVKDYIAKVSVDTDIPDLDIPQRIATVYVKPPDKTYVDSGGGFVIIPKRALLFGDISKDIQKEAKVFLAGTKQQDGQTIYCLKILPKAPEKGRTETGRVMVWVNGSRWTLERVQMLDGSKVLVEVAFTYVKTQGFWMPQRVACTIPPGIMGSAKAGHVGVSFSDYRLNTGLTDEFFRQKQQQQKGRKTPSHPRRPHGSPQGSSVWWAMRRLHAPAAPTRVADRLWRGADYL